MGELGKGAARARQKALFAAALELGREERAAFLARECAGDEELRLELEELLRHHSAADGFLARGIHPVEAERAPTLVGTKLGAYRLERELGRGGMGIVYLAEQESPRRKVAIKVLRLDAAAPLALARFRREAQILARLQHPGIAHVLEAGLTETEHGRLPWIALEHVRGRAIDEHVAASGPELPELLALLAKLCEVVDHAHQHGIVHRDLKPSNVLVDERGEVRVLDFGVARLVEAEAGEERTRTGQFVGTLAYASPEQVSGEGSSADARSDVYALGVLAFELVAGHLPYPVDESRVLESMRVIAEQEPMLLRRLRSDAPADLETILRKALEKDPRRRYASAGELRDELLRLLEHRPIAARPPSALYQATKLVRRHPAATGSTFALFAALSIAVVALALSRKDVRAQLERSNETLDFMASELASLVPELGFGARHRATLEAIDERIERQRERGPVSNTLAHNQARALLQLSELDLLRRLPEHALERAERARSVLEGLARADPDGLRHWTLLSQVYARIGDARRELGDLEGQDAWYRRALELDERLVREHPGERELVEDLGWSLERTGEALRRAGRKAEACALAERRLAEALPLVEAEPDNWKYVFNLMRAYFQATHCHDEPGQREAAQAGVEAMLRLAQRLRRIHPSRREFVRWNLMTHWRARELASAWGESEMELRCTTVAFYAAVELIRLEPWDVAHHWACNSAGEALALRSLELGRRERAAEVLEELRDLLFFLRTADGPPGEVGLLASTAGAIEEELTRSAYER